MNNCGQKYTLMSVARSVLTSCQGFEHIEGVAVQAAQERRLAAGK